MSPIPLNPPARRAVPADLARFRDRAAAASSLHDLRLVLSTLQGAMGSIASGAVFDPSGYTRRVLAQDDAVTIVLIGWLPGQASEIHDHGGSLCALRVLRGVATERCYDLAPDSRARLAAEDRYLAGSVLCCDGAGIHALANARDAAEPLVTLHVYRPAPVMRVYAPAHGEPA